jgi:hypothetical protein
VAAVAQQLSPAPLLIGAGALVFAELALPYVYYELLKFAIAALCVYTWRVCDMVGLPKFRWAFAAIGLVFMIGRFPRADWRVIDAAAAFAFFVLWVWGRRTSMGARHA